MDGHTLRCYGPRVPRLRTRTIAAVALSTLFVGLAWLGPLVGATSGPFVEPAPEGPAEVSLRDALSTAAARHGDRPCVRSGDRFTCGASPWLWVGRYLGRVTSNDGPAWRPCIWAHPPDPRGNLPVPVTVTFPRVLLRGDLHGEAAILDVPHTGDPVAFTIRIGQRQRARLTLTDGRDGDRRWQTWTVPAGTEAGRREDVTFEISTSHPSWRQVCFTAFVGPG